MREEEGQLLYIRQVTVARHYAFYIRQAVNLQPEAD